MANARLPSSTLGCAHGAYLAARRLHGARLDRRRGREHPHSAGAPGSRRGGRSAHRGPHPRHVALRSVRGNGGAHHVAICRRCASRLVDCWTPCASPSQRTGVVHSGTAPALHAFPASVSFSACPCSWLTVSLGPWQLLRSSEFAGWTAGPILLGAWLPQFQTLAPLHWTVYCTFPLTELPAAGQRWYLDRPEPGSWPRTPRRHGKPVAALAVRSGIAWCASLPWTRRGPGRAPLQLRARRLTPIRFRPCPLLAGGVDPAPFALPFDEVQHRGHE